MTFSSLLNSKKELGEKVINAGQYMLEEISKKVAEYTSSISGNSKILKTLNEIDNSQTEEEIKNTIEMRYISKEDFDTSKAKLKKGIVYRAPTARISSYKALNNKQSLEKNKIIAKLTILERVGGMTPIIPHTANNNLLVQTIGRAFSSLELIVITASASLGIALFLEPPFKLTILKLTSLDSSLRTLPRILFEFPLSLIISIPE